MRLLDSAIYLAGSLAMIACGPTHIDSEAFSGGAGGTVSATFEMVVVDVFNIRGRGPIVTGKIAAGKVTVGDTLVLVDGSASRPVTIAAIEKFREVGLHEASAGPDDVGIELQGITEDEVRRGNVLRTAQSH